MPRIPYPDESKLDADSKALLEKLPALNLFKMLGHAPHLLGPVVGLGSAFLQNGKLAPVTRECVILRVGYRSNASYETYQHERMGREAGMSEELIDAVKRGPGAQELSAEQRLALMYTDCLLVMPKPPLTRLRPVLAHFGPEKTQELTLLIGYYMMICRFLESFGVEIEDEEAAMAAAQSLPSREGRPIG